MKKLLCTLINYNNDLFASYSAINYNILSLPLISFLLVEFHGDHKTVTE